MSRVSHPEAPSIAEYAGYMNHVEDWCIDIAKTVTTYQGEIDDQAKYLHSLSCRMLDYEGCYRHDRDTSLLEMIRPTRRYFRHMKEYLPQFLDGSHTGSQIIRSAGSSLWRDYNSANGITAPFVIGVAGAVRRALIAVLVGKTRAGETSSVLELGAGVGATTDLLNQSIGRVDRYVATDRNSFYVKDLQDRYGHLGLQPQVFDIDQPEIDGQFNIVYATNFLHLSQNIGATLSWIHSKLEDGGKLIIGESSPYDGHVPSPLSVFYALFDEWWKVPTGAERLYPGFLPTATWVRYLHAAGFTKVQSESMAYKGRDLGAVIRAYK